MWDLISYRQAGTDGTGRSISQRFSSEANHEEIHSSSTTISFTTNRFHLFKNFLAVNFDHQLLRFINP